MSYDQNLADCEAALNEANLESFSWKASAEQNYAEWEEANKLLEQTIEVLEGLRKFPHQWCRADLGDVPRSRCICGKAQRDALAKPLLDNLKARKP